MKKHDLNTLEELVMKWSHERGITVNGKATTQALKAMAEMGELADNLIKDQDIRDDIGDICVVLINIAVLKGTTLTECLNKAYNDIKDRKGYLNEHGNFIKSTDPAYKQLVMEFDDED